MAVRVEIPGRPNLDLDVLLVDVNGTLTTRGELVDGVAERCALLRERLEIVLLSADTYGTLGAVAGELQVEARLAAGATDKLRELERCGAARCVAMGNGSNDVEMLAAAALGIAVMGAEGASSAALAAADVVCRSSVEALDLLLEPRLLVATLRR